MNNKTLAFYNKNAKAFAEETAFVDFKETQDKFINILQELEIKHLQVAGKL